MKRFIPLVLALVLSSCALLGLKPVKNPDGTLDLPVLYEYAQYGIDADCAFGTGALANEVCKTGTDAINLAKTKSPAAAKVVLLDVEQAHPDLVPYLDWLVKLLPDA
jgi:hypothetical protein